MLIMTNEEFTNRLETIEESFNDVIKSLKDDYKKKSQEPPINNNYTHGQYFILNASIYLLAYVNSNAEFQLIDISTGCRYFINQLSFKEINEKIKLRTDLKPITNEEAMKYMRDRHF